MLQMASPPKPGTYVEITAEGASIAARVIWRREHKCGVRTREKIDVEALVGNSSIKLVERPAAAERPRRQAGLQQADAARVLGRAIDFWLVTGGGVVLAICAATAVYQLLSGSFALIEGAL